MEDANVVVVAFLLRLPGTVQSEGGNGEGKERVLMDLEIGVTKWRVEGDLEEFG